MQFLTKTVTFCHPHGMNFINHCCAMISLVKHLTGGMSELCFRMQYS